jgi:hypothetical protein
MFSSELFCVLFHLSLILVIFRNVQNKMYVIDPNVYIVKIER